MKNETTDAIRGFLRAIEVLPRRLWLDTPGEQASVPMLRGVWGAALHDLHSTAYKAVYDVDDSPSKTAGYVLRPAPPDSQLSPAIDYLLIAHAIEFDRPLLRAWDIASGMGLGPQRRRFHIREYFAITPDGGIKQSDGNDEAWTLDHAQWPLKGPAESTPCQLDFIAPLRMLYKGRLIECPKLADIVVGAMRRVDAFLPQGDRPAWKDLRSTLLDEARNTPCEQWEGERLDLVRYSGRQRRELTLHGVSGTLVLPNGPGPLWPLLSAAMFLHIGKSTTVGLGQFNILPL